MEYTVTDGSVAGRGGAISTRDYRPARDAGGSPLLWIHGGGFVLGGLDMKESDAPARFLASEGRWVRTLHYRLSPHLGLFSEPKLGPAAGRFPEAHEDVLDVAAALRADSGRAISVGGASAGGNLAAGAVVAMRDAGIEPPRSVALVYGLMHSELPDDPEVESGLRGPIVRWIFNPDMTRRILLNYTGDASVFTDVRAFPGGSDLTGLPPTLTLDARNDRLRRSGHAYHLELERAGVTTQEVVVDARHGFLGAPRKKPFAIGMAAMSSWLQRWDG